MSLSRRKRASAKPLDDELTQLPCAECGSQATVKRTRGSYKFADGTSVRNLGYYRCSKCRAAFFDLAAMKEIRRQRAKRKVHA
jgi:DNA-directed RNA polymerase subunit RPC12/RpoP